MKIAAFYENIADGARAKGIPVEQAVRDLMEEGLELLYIGSFSLERDRAEVLDVLAKTGIGVEGIHAWTDYAHQPERPDEEEILRAAAELGAGNVLIVPGLLREGDDREAVRENIRIGMERAVRRGKEAGIPVSMEDFDGMESLFCTADGLGWFLEKIPGLACSFDTGNFVMYREDEMAAYFRFREKICTVHLKDRKDSPKYPDEQYKVCADGARSYVAPVGSGTMRIAEILDDLQKTGYTGNVIAELFDYSPSHMLEGIAESVRWLSSRV